MELTRRGFLKAIATVGAGIIAMPAIKLIVPTKELLLANERWIANVRELVMYDIVRDYFVCRHDILVKDVQIGVDSILTGPDAIHVVRESSARLLADKIAHEGWSLSELRPLPIPAGYISAIVPRETAYIGQES